MDSDDESAAAAPLRFRPELARKLTDDLFRSRFEENAQKCSELRKQVPVSVLAALHDDSDACFGDDDQCPAQNQNYVKGGLIYMPATNLQFERFLKRSRGPVVIDFYARWLSEAIKSEKGKVKVVRVNVSKLPQIADRYDVSVTPTAVGIGCGGREVSRLMGATDEKSIRGFVKDIVKSCKTKKRSTSADRYDSDVLINERQSRLSRQKDRPKHIYEKSTKRSVSETRPFLSGGQRSPHPPTTTHKQFFFTNESISSKPLTMIPGIGAAYAARMESQGIKSAKQLVGIYMQDRNMVSFQHFLRESFNMNERWSKIATEAIEQVVRHMI